MFIPTENLNEGACCKNQCEGHKRELKEGKNPKETNASWHSATSSSHVNEHWQQLRK